jgi:hypothetical protein
VPLTGWTSTAAVPTSMGITATIVITTPALKFVHEGRTDLSNPLPSYLPMYAIPCLVPKQGVL